MFCSSGKWIQYINVNSKSLSEIWWFRILRDKSFPTPLPWYRYHLQIDPKSLYLPHSMEFSSSSSGSPTGVEIGSFGMSRQSGSLKPLQGTSRAIVTVLTQRGIVLEHRDYYYNFLPKDLIPTSLQFNLCVVWLKHRPCQRGLSSA